MRATETSEASEAAAAAGAAPCVPATGEPSSLGRREGAATAAPSRLLPRGIGCTAVERAATAALAGLHPMLALCSGFFGGSPWLVKRLLLCAGFAVGNTP